MKTIRIYKSDFVTNVYRKLSMVKFLTGTAKKI